MHRPGRRSQALDPATDRRRLEQLVSDHGDAVLGYLLRRSDEPEDASDAFADVLLVAWRRLDKVPVGDEARLWLFGVARRTLANAQRSARRRARLGERLRQELSAASRSTETDTTEFELVHEALMRLSEQHREVLLLNAWEGLEPTEIAAVVGIVPATARTRLRRARNQLRRELEAMGSLPEARSNELSIMKTTEESQ